MKKFASVLIVVLGWLLIVAAVWMPRHAPASAATANAAPVTAAAQPPSAAPPAAALAGIAESEPARRYRQRQRFERQAREFLRTAGTLGAVQRSERARELSADIDRYEQSGGLSAGEALLLRTGLIKATIADGEEQAMRIADLMERYRLRAERGMADHLARQQADPSFQSYKSRERQIVAEVMAMTAMPAGLTRDQYLRQRLQQERERAYTP
ncbi:hypothetical protein [Pseudoxanthomonas wuyuanensis]|uniref:Lipase modulator n=1 Tax=Pseudoxanthomonas wuyuanensis TaxID=1073196 RepID=A0A286CVT1_9GAMM|nr:hypothetical protein [Pseudoxanthomonas wuyuanensis]KAF1721291.1 hypothetical protein CSC75_07725 [Pseudoxanthomonas wuyuanensis]SOD50465.1 hypothetical protein SAMN06296416_101135 [Pseudoxanthomonas wuyuanensis]